MQYALFSSSPCQCQSLDDCDLLSILWTKAIFHAADLAKEMACYMGGGYCFGGGEGSDTLTSHFDIFMSGFQVGPTFPYFFVKLLLFLLFLKKALLSLLLSSEKTSTQ